MSFSLRNPFVGMGPRTQERVADVFVIAVLFFGARWLARDAHNGLRLSLFALLVIAWLYLGIIYVGSVSAFKRYAKTSSWPRAYALGTVALAWIATYAAMWAVMLRLSSPDDIDMLTAGDGLLAPEFAPGGQNAGPASALARTARKTSLGACRKLVDCENSSTQANFEYMMDKKSACEECVRQGKCPASNADGETECVEGNCNRTCVNEDLLERYADAGACPNAVAFATALPDEIKYIEATCKSDFGACWYGCDGGSSGDTCSRQWRSMENEPLNKELDKVETGIGYPSEAACKRKHKRCKKTGCMPERAGTAPPDNASNCYCQRAVQPGKPPCARLASLCDRTSPQYAAAQLVDEGSQVADDIRQIDQTQLAEDVRELDAILSEALML